MQCIEDLYKPLEKLYGDKKSEDEKVKSLGMS